MQCRSLLCLLAGAAASARGRDQKRLAAASATGAAEASVYDAMLVSQRLPTFSTFAHVPYAPCFVPASNGTDQGGSSSSSSSSDYDIAILGAPHDISTTVRPGARFGPGDIRTASLIKSYGYSAYTGRDPFRDWARVVDCGDANLTPVDKLVALRTLDRAHQLAVGRPAAHPRHSPAPRVLMLGGDHSTTLSALRAARQRWGPVAVVHFDSHIDTWDTEDSVSEYAKLDHGTFLYFAHEEGLILDTSIHVGIRAPHYFRRDESNDRRCGFDTVTARDLDSLGVHGVVDRVRRRVGPSAPVYVTVDIDVLDTALAPATGTPEPGGWSTRELLAVLHGLEGLRIVGSDVVEVAPAYDNKGQTTALAAAEVVVALLDLMVSSPTQNASSASL